MPTISKKTADKIVAMKGIYKDDPPVVRIIEYDNAFGGVGYGLEYERTVGTYSETYYVRNPRIYWERGK